MTMLPPFETTAEIEAAGAKLDVKMVLSVREFGSTTPMKDLRIESWTAFQGRGIVGIGNGETEIRHPKLVSQIAFALGRYVEQNRQRLLMEAQNVHA